jgi:hypothetical protein
VQSSLREGKLHYVGRALRPGPILLMHFCIYGLAIAADGWGHWHTNAFNHIPQVAAPRSPDFREFPSDALVPLATGLHPRF